MNTALTDAELAQVDDQLELRPGTTSAVVAKLVAKVLGKTTHNGPPLRPQRTVIDLSDLLQRWDPDDIPAGLTLLRDALDNASDQAKTTWVAENGKIIAAVVPVPDAEYLEAQQP
jgi:hypothetical protein